MMELIEAIIFDLWIGQPWIAATLFLFMIPAGFLNLKSRKKPFNFSYCTAVVFGALLMGLFWPLVLLWCILSLMLDGMKEVASWA